MKDIKWEKLPSPIIAFTVRAANMADLTNGCTVRQYLANTRIDLIEKCVTEKGTYYRTETAAKNNLNWAFKATAFGLPNEFAPSAPVNPSLNSFPLASPKKAGIKKQKDTPKDSTPKDGEEKSKKSLLKRLFRK